MRADLSRPCRAAPCVEPTLGIWHEREGGKTAFQKGNQAVLSIILTDANRLGGRGRWWGDYLSG